MALFYTADPARDALNHDDSIERQCEMHAAAQKREHKRLSDALVEALQHGAGEPVANVIAGEALYEVQCDHVDGTKRVEQLVYWAARQTDNPVLRAMVREIADAFADLRGRT